MFKNIIALSALAFCRLSAPASAQSVPVPDDRLAVLEQKVKALEEAQARFKAVPAAAAPAFSRKMAFGGVLQPRYDYTRDASPKVNTFSVRRARFFVEGEVYENVGYKVLAAFSDKGAAFQVLDAKVIFRHMGPAAVLEIGQLKSDGVEAQAPQHLQFVDYANAGATLRPACVWDRGLLLSGSFLARRLGYGLHLVNGNGVEAATAGVNDNAAFRNGFFLQYDPLGPAEPNMQNDIRLGPLRFGGRVSAAHSRENDAVTGRQSVRWLAADLYARGSGFYGKITASRQNVDDTAGALKNQAFWMAQAGKAFPVKHGHFIEPAVQYQVLNKDLNLPAKHERWLTLGTNYYFGGGLKSKLQANYILKSEQSPNRVKNNTMQLMYTLIF